MRLEKIMKIIPPQIDVELHDVHVHTCTYWFKMLGSIKHWSNRVFE